MPSRRKLEIKEEATLEIEDAFLYYEEQRSELGDQFLEQLERALKSIQRSPHGYASIHHRYRQFPLGQFPFVVVYEVLQEAIIVYAVFHTSRHPRKKIR